MARRIPSNVLVMGGAGFIGSHLVEELISRCCSVIILDNFSPEKKENLKRFDAQAKVRRHYAQLTKTSQSPESLGIRAQVRFAEGLGLLVKNLQ